MSGEPTLEKGVSNDWVTHLQELMRDGGFWQGDTNGTFDDDLEQAVQQLQENLGLQQTGIVDDETWSALEQQVQSTQQADQQTYQQTDQQADQQTTQADGSADTSQPQLSDDGQWQWDGTQWQPVNGSSGDASSQSTQQTADTAADTSTDTATSTATDTSSTDTSSYPTLSKGMSSEWVPYLQQVMQYVGFWNGATDGSFGDDLEQAVQAMQGSNGLQQTGVVDGQTWDLLTNLQQSGGGSGGSSASGASGGADGGASPDGGSASGADGGATPDGGSTGGADGGVTPDGGTTPDGGGGAGQQQAASIPVDPGLAVMAGGHQYVIFTDEVREGGSVSWKARNPGNIRNGDSYGAYPGKRVSAGSSGHFAVFPDEATGFAAIKSVLHGYGHVTVAQAMGRYAPAGDGANDPNAYAAQVARQMGVPVTTFVDQLSDDQLAVFATAIRRVEGWIVGHTFSLTDPTLPNEVKHAINGN